MVIVSKACRASGLAVGAVLLSSVAQAAQPNRDRYIVDLKIAIAGENTTASKLARAGEPFTVAGWKDGKKWIADFLLTPEQGEHVALKTRFYFDGRSVGALGARLQLGGSAYTGVARDEGQPDLQVTIEQSVKLAPKLSLQERHVP
ncbi:hypothetical protein SAMN05428948_3637 [Massilia sp. CF038]|nr:hypothetical protein SAMN05428948_3637 [Massilia sp. CF038]